MGYRDASNKEKSIIVTNTVLRSAQVIVALVIISIYNIVQRRSSTDQPGKLSYEIAIGVLAMILGLAMGVLPFHYSYRPVALCAILDFIMVALYGVAFSFVRGMYNSTVRYAATSHAQWDKPRNYIISYANNNASQRAKDLLTFGRYSYINIAALILFAISGIMGAVLIFVGRKNAKSTGTSKV